MTSITGLTTLMQPCDAALIDREDGLMVARHAIVADHALTWPAAITVAASDTAHCMQVKYFIF